MQSLNVLVLSALRFLSVALTCFSSLCRPLNAKWWGDKTLSIKTCFMTTWDSWLVLQNENSGGFEAKVSLRDLTASLTRLPKAYGILAQHSRLLSWQKSIKRYSALGRHTHSWAAPNQSWAGEWTAHLSRRSIKCVEPLCCWAGCFLSQNNRPVNSVVLPAFLQHNQQALLHSLSSAMKWAHYWFLKHLPTACRKTQSKLARVKLGFRQNCSFVSADWFKQYLRISYDLMRGNKEALMWHLVTFSTWMWMTECET